MTEPDKRQSAFFEGAKKAYSVLQVYDKDPEANFFYVINQLSYLNETSFLRAYIFINATQIHRKCNANILTNPLFSGKKSSDDSKPLYSLGMQ